MIITIGEDKFFNDETNEYYEGRNRNWVYYKSEFFSLVHREKGPAYIFSNRDKSYLIDGRLHRLDGPARDWSKKQFFIDGFDIGILDFSKMTNHLICKFCYKFCKQGCF